MTERPIQRSSPPFGEMPALVEGDYELLVTLDSGTLSLAGFFCSPHGVTASFRTALLVRNDAVAPFAFEYRAPPVDHAALDVWAQQVGDDDPEGRVFTSIRNGGGGTHGGVRAVTYYLWFPLDPAELRSDVQFVISWSELGDQRPTQTITKEALQAAASRADNRFIRP